MSNFNEKSRAAYGKKADSYDKSRKEDTPGHRTKDGIEFTELVEINCLDLNKLPIEDDNTELWFWMKFIKTDDEGVLDLLAQRNPQMKKAVGVLKRLSADERTRMLYENREKARMDYESRVDEIEKKWQIVIADKDAKIADKEAEIAKLRAQLEKQNI